MKSQSRPRGGCHRVGANVAELDWQPQTPYAAAPNLPFPPLPNFLVLWWDVEDSPDPQTPNASSDPKTACAIAQAGAFGAPLLDGIAKYAAQDVRASQYFSNPYNPFHIPSVPAAGYAAIALDEIGSQAGAEQQVNSDLSLTESSEFRFVSAGDSASVRTYSTNPDTYFVNLDLIGFIEPTQAADYPFITPLHSTPTSSPTSAPGGANA
jgi:hypothetical protein